MDSIPDRLERRYGRFAIENLTSYLIAGQIVAFVMILANPAIEPMLILQGNAVLHGQVWRLLSMLMVPLDMRPVFAVLTWYLYFLYGSVLEREWGSFRYTLYVAMAYFGTVACSFILPRETFGSGYIFGSIFLAFAYLYPDFKLYIFYIIPVKVKWLAILIWIGTAASIILGSLPTKLMAGVSVANFLLFFAGDIIGRLKTESNGIRNGTASVLNSRKTYMSCAVCHKTEHDRKIFYWCHDCTPDTCYCEDHIRTHTHKKA